MLSVHLEDRHLQTMSWKGEVYIDHYIPFGLRSAPKLFNILADLLLLAAQKAGVSYVTVLAKTHIVCTKTEINFIATVDRHTQYLSIPSVSSIKC